MRRGATICSGIHMEFLDPEEKRERTIRLFLGYAVAAALVLLGTLAISFILQGFNIFNRSSDVRNGLLFVDSKPVSADIYIDDQPFKRTDARLVIPEGTHRLKLVEPGYRDWQKDVDIVGGSVLYTIYPRLFPVAIRKTVTATYEQQPKLWTQSLDRKWIVVSNSASTPTFDVFDTTRPNEAPTVITIPEAVLSAQDIATSELSVVEWSSDNRRFVVLKRAPDGVKQYLLIDKDKPDESLNITAQLSLAQQVSLRLRDKKYNQYYLHNSETKVLQRASLSGGIEPLVVADNVVAYKPYEADVLLYATTSGATEDAYNVRILDGTTSYLLQPVKKSDIVLLDVARYDGDWFFVVGSSNEQAVVAYVNPLKSNAEVDPANGFIVPQILLQTPGAVHIGFSDNARFIGAQNSNSFTVYDAELEKVYAFNSPVALPTGGAKWMDGHRYHVVSNGAEQVFEFDGKNHQTLSNAYGGNTAYYDRDYVRLFNLAEQSDGSFDFQVSNLTLTD